MRAWFLNNFDRRSNANGRNNLNNNARLLGIVQAIAGTNLMRTYKNLYQKLTSYENLEKAFRKARKGKSSKPYVIDFEKNLKENLISLQFELEGLTYAPKPLNRFVIADPKTRVIHSSAFRDRVVH